MDQLTCLLDILISYLILHQIKERWLVCVFSSQYLTNDIKGHLIIELYGGMEYTGCFFHWASP